jgi:hypothetical protein
MPQPDDPEMTEDEFVSKTGEKILIRRWAYKNLDDEIDYILYDVFLSTQHGKHIWRATELAPKND